VIAFSDQREEYDLVEIPLDGSSPRNMLATSRSETYPSWSPVGNEYAYVTDRGGTPEIGLRSREGSLERPVVTAASFQDATLLISGLAFAPDGRRVAYQRRGANGFRVWISAVAGGPAVQLVVDDSYQDAPTWSPDGTWVAYATSRAGRRTLAKVKVGAGEAPVVLKEGIVYPSNPRWSPDGAYITCDLPQGFSILSASGKQSRILSEETPLVHAWAADSRSLFAIRSEGSRLQLVSIDVATGREKVLLPDVGLFPPTADPLQGLSVATGGRSLLTSVVRLRGDVWLLSGFEPRRPRLLDRFLGRRAAP
jgi:Tol biopolymer transport system component